MSHNNEFDPIGGDGVPASPDAVPQEAGPRIITAQPIQWEAHRSGQQWTEGRYGYCITLESADLPETPYVATLGEGDPETFATLAEAQAWCQRDIDATVARWAVVAAPPPQAAPKAGAGEAARQDSFDRMLSTLRYVLGAGQAKDGESARDHYNAIINAIADRAERTVDADVRRACEIVKRAALAQAEQPAAPAVQPATDLQRECDAVDYLLQRLGLDPERCRTEGGAINLGRVKSLLAEEERPSEPVEPKPVAWQAHYIDRDGNPAVYTTSNYALAVENDINGSPMPLYAAPSFTGTTRR